MGILFLPGEKNESISSIKHKSFRPQYGDSFFTQFLIERFDAIIDVECFRPQYGDSFFTRSRPNDDTSTID